MENLSPFPELMKDASGSMVPRLISIKPALSGSYRELYLVCRQEDLSKTCYFEGSIRKDVWRLVSILGAGPSR